MRDIELYWQLSYYYNLVCFSLCTPSKTALNNFGRLYGILENYIQLLTVIYKSTNL